MFLRMLLRFPRPLWAWPWYVCSMVFEFILLGFVEILWICKLMFSIKFEMFLAIVSLTKIILYLFHSCLLLHLTIHLCCWIASMLGCLMLPCWFLRCCSFFLSHFTFCSLEWAVFCLYRAYQFFSSAVSNHILWVNFSFQLYFSAFSFFIVSANFEHILIFVMFLGYLFWILYI